MTAHFRDIFLVGCFGPQCEHQELHAAFTARYLHLPYTVTMHQLAHSDLAVNSGSRVLTLNSQTAKQITSLSVLVPTYRSTNSVVPACIGTLVSPPASMAELL